VGENDAIVRDYGRRVETFEIYDNERLIGCEIYQKNNYFRGVTWIKMKVD
jgi:hypothetical protein